MNRGILGGNLAQALRKQRPTLGQKNRHKVIMRAIELIETGAVREGFSGQTLQVAVHRAASEVLKHRAKKGRR